MNYIYTVRYFDLTLKVFGETPILRTTSSINKVGSDTSLVAEKPMKRNRYHMTLTVSIQVAFSTSRGFDFT
jgi:hypothetical protein